MLHFIDVKYDSCNMGRGKWPSALYGSAYTAFISLPPPLPPTRAFLQLYRFPVPSTYHSIIYKHSSWRSLSDLTICLSISRAARRNSELIPDQPEHSSPQQSFPSLYHIPAPGPTLSVFSKPTKMQCSSL